MKLIYCLMLVMCSIACSCTGTNYESERVVSIIWDRQELDKVGSYLSGVILDSIAEVGYYVDRRLGFDRIEVDSNRFSMELDGAGPQIVSFHAGYNFYPMYLASGDSLRLEFYDNDLQNGFNRISFSGGHIEENELLLDLRKILRYKTTEHNYFYNCPESTFLRKIDSLKENSMAILDASNRDLTESFKEMYTTYVEYELAHYILKYPLVVRRGFGGGIVEKSAEFLKREESAFKEDPDLLENAAYRGYLSRRMHAKVSSVFSDPGFNKQGRSSPTLELYIDMIDSLFNNRQIKDYLKFSKIQWDLNYGDDDATSVLESYKNTAPDTDYIRNLEEAAAARDEERSREYIFVDASGLERNLHEFKGKIIYVDIWATWCGPCLIERKYFEALVSKFATRKDDIEFIGISVDLDANRWRAMVADEGFTGIQFLAEDGLNSRICKDFKIQGIPRFMIFDRNGIVIRQTAMSPSMDGIEEYLLSLIGEI